MEKQIHQPYNDHASWLDCIGELKDDRSHMVHALSPKKEASIPLCQQKEAKKQPLVQNDCSNQELIDLISMHQCIHQGIDMQMFKRSHTEPMIDDEFFTSNSSSSDFKNNQNDQVQGQTKSGYKKEKYAKQYIYSKNYRDKKKEQFKALEQQNKFLKNKVDELFMRLREKEMEVNRLKHHSTEKELTIEDLNRQFLTKVSLFAEKIQNSISKISIQEQRSTFQKTRTIYCDQLIKTYDEHGFSGSRKKSILNYHMNEIMEVVLRDSEKYLCMLCCKNKDDKLERQMPEYQKINTAFLQITELKKEDLDRLHRYIQFLFPVMKEIKKQCSEFFKSYIKIIECMDKVHQFMRSSYIQNLDFVKKRMKLQNWFQYHKYHKIMRNLKAEWLEFIKCERLNGNQSKKKRKNGYKKKKTQQTQNQQA